MMQQKIATRQTVILKRQDITLTIKRGSENAGDNDNNTGEDTDNAEEEKRQPIKEKIPMIQEIPPTKNSRDNSKRRG